MIKIYFPDGTLKTDILTTNLSLKEYIIQLKKKYPEYIISLIFQDYEKELDINNLFACLLHVTTKGYINNTQNFQKELIYPIIITPSSQTPSLWETSASVTRKEVTLICDKNGKKKKAIFINTNEDSQNNALIPIEQFDYLIKTLHKNNYFTTTVYQITNLNIEESFAYINAIHIISDNPNESDLSYERFYQKFSYLKSVIRSSKKKALKGKTQDIHYCFYQHLLKKS